MNWKHIILPVQREVPSYLCPSCWPPPPPCPGASPAPLVWRTPLGSWSYPALPAWCTLVKLWEKLLIRGDSKNSQKGSVQKPKRLFFGQADRKGGGVAWPKAFVKILCLFFVEYDSLILKMDFLSLWRGWKMPFSGTFCHLFLANSGIKWWCYTHLCPAQNG